MKRETKYEICGDYAKIYTSSEGKFFLCDLDDVPLAISHSWQINSDGYAKCHDSTSGKTVKFHRMIFKTRKGYVTDHINRNRLDNRKSNLREVTIIENSNNKICQQNMPSQCIHQRKNGRYYVEIRDANRKTRKIGTYDTLDEAIKARNLAYIKYKGVSFPNI